MFNEKVGVQKRTPLCVHMAYSHENLDEVTERPIKFKYLVTYIIRRSPGGDKLPLLPIRPNTTVSLELHAGFTMLPSAYSVDLDNGNGEC